VLGSVVFVARTGRPRRLLPKALGGGGSPADWRRIRAWQQAGDRERPRTTFVSWLGDEADRSW
jgi:hypothetical protein